MQISATNLLLAAQQQAQSRTVSRTPAPAHFELASFEEVSAAAEPGLEPAQSTQRAPANTPAAGIGTLLDIRV